MEREELVRRLERYEWTDVEFKEARRGVPESAYETVSAFSNTEGGWLIFGVQDNASGFEIVGVLEVDKVQNDFLSVLRSGQKLNRVVAAKEQLIEDDGKALLVFHIPEARRRDKPIYLNNDITRSYIRRGAGDERCTPEEIGRMLRDSADERHDGETVDLDSARCFDDESLRWYRKLFEDRNPDHDDSLSHLEFLRYWGLVVETGGRLSPTRAAVLLFGADPAFRQILPRPVVDWQWHRGNWSEDLPEERWADRLVIEANLVKVWKALMDRYMQRAEKPFSVDPETLRREDRPPDYVAFREAAINLLIHQDYADHTRKPTIRFFDDRTLLWNPGDALASAASAEELMEPGEREVRNPRIVAAFRRIGLSEQAGTGIGAIFGTWRRLGRVPPIIENDKARKSFQLTLLKEELLSQEQILFQARLGVHLTDEQARAFAFVRREGEMSRSQLRAVTGLSGPDAAAVAERLAAQRLIEPVGAGGRRYALAEHLKERLEQTDLVTAQVDAPDPRLVTDQPDAPAPNLVTDQVGRPQGNLSTAQAHRPPPDLSTTQVESLTELSETHRKIVALGAAPRRLTEIMAALGVTGRNHFRRRHLNPLIRAGIVAMTHPDRPNHPDQAYVLTDTGAPDPRLVTDQPDMPAPNLVTDQAGRPQGNLVTAQAHRPPPDLSTAQVEPLTELSATHRKIVALCDVPRRLTEIMAALGVTGRDHFRGHHLNPLIRGGVLRMTHPDRPNHPDQAYVLTDAGAALKARRADGG